MQETVNGIRMHWRETGHGPPVVFVHGFPFHGGIWDEQLDRLPERWRWIVPDLRGFGRSSDEAEGAYGMDLFADDLAALLDTLGIDRATLCGSSMGGYIALAMWNWHPGRIQAFVLCDTRAGADTRKNREARMRLARAVHKEGAGAAVDGLLPQLVSERTRRERPEVVDRVRDMIEAAPPHTMVRALEGMAQRPDSTDLLPSIDAPALVVRGSDDEIVNEREARYLAENIPDARLRTIPGTGHLPNIEAPAEFNRALVQFLEAIQGTGRVREPGADRAPRRRRGATPPPRPRA